MLQHNRPAAGKAHLAHFAVMALHAVCCGVPALALLAAALSGAASGSMILLGAFSQFHDFLHVHEFWIIAVSAVLVCSGAVFEVRMRRGRGGGGFPVLFAASVCCFFANLAIVLAHRAGL